MKVNRKKETKNDKKKTFIFRRFYVKQGNKSARHPKLIVDVKKKDNSFVYGHMGLTEEKYNGHHSNIPLLENPYRNKKNKKKQNIANSYLRKKIEYNDSRLFSEILKDYKLSKKDLDYIVDYVNKHKKR